MYIHIDQPEIIERVCIFKRDIQRKVSESLHELFHFVSEVIARVSAWRVFLWLASEMQELHTDIVLGERRSCFSAQRKADKWHTLKTLSGADFLRKSLIFTPILGCETNHHKRGGFVYFPRQFLIFHPNSDELAEQPIKFRKVSSASIFAWINVQQQI